MGDFYSTTSRVLRIFNLPTSRRMAHLQITQNNVNAA